ncbi:MAG TPA: ABC transporter substrate-binding protein, partial [Acetobacteraceae bacterium]
EVMGEHQVKLKLQRPWGSAFSMLADRGGAMNSPAAVKALGLDYGMRPVATGPFKIAEVVTGSHVRFVRNENYWGRDAEGNRLPYLDEIVITYVQDPTVQVAALRAGEADLIYLPYRDVAAFADNKNFNVNRFDGGSIAYLLSFDLGKPPMDNVNLRLAVAHAINPEAINKAVYFNKALVAKGGMWPVGAWAYDPSVARPHYDPAKARDYLKKGGKPDGFTLDAITWTSQEHIPSAEIVRAQLGAIGIKLNLQVYNVSVATEKFYGGREAPLFLTSWSRYPEPDWIGSLNYKSDGYYNAGKLKDPRMDALIEAGAAELDIEKRKAIYRKVDEIALGEAWFVPMLYGVNYAAAPKPVQGLDTVFGWDAKMDLRRLWLRK